MSKRMTNQWRHAMAEHNGVAGRVPLAVLVLALAWCLAGGLAGNSTANAAQSQDQVYSQAVTLAKEGKTDAAFAALTKLLDECGYTNARIIRKEPAFAPLKDDKRFQEILDKAELNSFQGSKFVLPENIKEGEKVPLFVWLHGQGGKPAGEIGRFAPLAKEGYAVLVPDYMTDASGGKVASVIEYVTKHYPVAADQVYMAGHSAGGHTCYSALTKDSDLLAGMVIFSGSMRFANPTTEELTRAARVPVVIVHGTGDRAVPFANALAAQKSLQDAGGKTLLVQYAGGHMPPANMLGIIRDGIRWCHTGEAGPQLKAGAAGAQASVSDLELKRQAAVRAKRYDEALAAGTEMNRLVPGNPVTLYNMACALALLGKKDEALAALDSAVQAGFTDVAHMKQDTDLDSLRGEKKYQEIIEKAGGKQKDAPTSERCGPSAVDLLVGPAQGAGAIVHEAGYIITVGHHAVWGERGTALLWNGKRCPARMILAALSPQFDVSLMKMEADQELTPFVLGRGSAVTVGEPVTTIGNPRGRHHTASGGTVSALNCSVMAGQDRLDGMIQAKLPAGPGNSGGPLFNSQGEMIGVVESVGGGVTYSVPIDRVRDILANLLEDGEGTGVWLGMHVERTGNPRVIWVDPGSPAEKAGVKPGDLVREIGALKVQDSLHVSLGLVDRKAGEALPLVLERGGKAVTVSATLGSAPCQPPLAKSLGVMGPGWWCITDKAKLQEACQKAIEGYEKFPATDLHYGRALYFTAGAYALMGEKAKAVEFLKKAGEAGWGDYARVNTEPRFRDIRGEPGYKEAAEAVRRRAGQGYEKRLAADPKNGTILYDAARFAALAGDKAKAVALLNQAVEMGCGDASTVAQEADFEAIRSEKGYKKILGELCQKAIATYQKTLAENPNDANALYNGACAYSLSGDKEKAVEFLKKAVEAGFKDFAHIEKDTDLNAIRNEAGYKELLHK